MNSGKTAIARKSVSAPMKYLGKLRGPPYGPMNVLHFGEGKAYEDTKYLKRNGARVTSYDPNSENPFARDPTLLDLHYDFGFAIYVFNTLTPHVRTAAFHKLLNCCDRVIIAVRTDKVDGQPYEDGVITKLGTFQTQRKAKLWLHWFATNMPEGDTRTVHLLHSTGHYTIIEVVK